MTTAAAAPRTPYVYYYTPLTYVLWKSPLQLLAATGLMYFYGGFRGQITALSAIEIAVQLLLATLIAHLAPLLLVFVVLPRVRDRFRNTPETKVVRVLAAIGLAGVAVVSTAHVIFTLPLPLLIGLSLTWSPFINTWPLLALERWEQRKGTKPPSLVLPPTQRMQAVFAWVFTTKTMTRVYDPVFAENLEEWLTAETRGQRNRARWVKIRGGLILLHTLGKHLVAGVIKSVVDMYKVLAG